MSKKKQGPKNRIQRFLGRASSQTHDLAGANQKRTWGRASSQPHDLVGAKFRHAALSLVDSFQFVPDS
jgi:hypothetical protein